MVTRGTLASQCKCIENNRIITKEKLREIKELVEKRKDVKRICHEIIKN